MPVSCATGSFQKSNATSPTPGQAHITGLSFQPKALMLMGIANGTTGLTVFTDIERPGFGWTAGSTQNYSVSWGAIDSTTAANTGTHRRARNDACYTHGSSASTAYPIIKLNQFTADGATFDYSLNDTNSYRIWYFAVGGSDITAVKAGQFTPNNTTGNQTIADVGFQPDIVFFMTGNSPTITNTSTTPNSTPHMVMSLGVAKSSTARACTTVSSVDDVSPSDSARYQRADKCIAFFTEGSVAVDAEADFVSTNANGFVINWTDAPSVQHPIFYLAIQGGSWNVGTTLSRTDTASGGTGPGTTAITGLGHTPKGLILFGHQGTATGTVQVNSKISFGAAGSSASSYWNVATGNQDNTTFPTSYRSYSNAVIYRSDDFGTANQNNVHAGNEATYERAKTTLSSFDTNTGFTLNHSLVDGSARQLIYVTVGDNVGQQIKKVLPAETVGLSETALIKNLGRVRTIAGGTVGFTEGTLLKALGKVRITPTETVGLTEPATPIAKTAKVFAINETVGLTAEMLTVKTLRRMLAETVGLTDELRPIKISPTSTLQASALQLRYSGGTNNQTTTASRGGAMSNHSVTDDTPNNAWDDITSVQSQAGIEEYRCFYIYNTGSITAYNCEMWVDLNTPAGDIIEIGVGSAAMGGTEQDLTTSAETEPPSGVDFSPAPDPDSAIPLGHIPSLTARSFWVKRTVPTGTPSWSDNLYRLRLSFYSDHAALTPPPPPPPAAAGFTTSGFTSTGFVT